MDAKKMSLIDKFNGGEAEYRDWARSFKGTIRLRSGKLVRLMEKVETNEDMTTEKAVEMMELEEQEMGARGTPPDGRRSSESSIAGSTY